MIRIKDKIIYWLDIAEYDLTTAQAMLKTRRLLYVGFLCHQVAEKCLKAYFWHTQKKEPPYTHNLLVLSEKSLFNELKTERQSGLFNQLMPLNIQARYPEDKNKLLKTLDLKICKDMLEGTREFYLWIKKLLK